MFRKWPKTNRMFSDVVITEKLDGTNSCVIITDDCTGYEDYVLGSVGSLYVLAQSRNRLLTLDNDNHLFAAFVAENAESLASLGIGYWYGEWWGSRIARGYGVDSKHFSLFDTNIKYVPSCCSVVPVLYSGELALDTISKVIASLSENGSIAAPGFRNVEGIIVSYVNYGTKLKVLINK